MANPFLTQRQQVAVKIETTTGVDAVPGDPDVISPVFEPEYTPEVEMNERETVQASFSRITQIAGERSAQITFSTELKGSGTAGTAPANLSTPIQACGFAETIVATTSVTYDPASVDLKSATVEIREAGVVSGANTVKQKKIIGARGTFTITAAKGQPVMIAFTFTGKYIEPSDVAALFATPSLGQVPEPFLNAAISFQSVGTLKIQNVELDLGQEVALRNDANDASGNTEAVITGRTPTGSLDPEQEQTATINFFAKWTEETEGTLSYVLGAVAGNIFTFTATKTQITGVAEGDRDGIRIETLEVAFNQDAVVGDDEFSLAFT